MRIKDVQEMKLDGGNAEEAMKRLLYELVIHQTAVGIAVELLNFHKEIPLLEQSKVRKPFSPAVLCGNSQLFIANSSI